MSFNKVFCINLVSVCLFICVSACLGQNNVSKQERITKEKLDLFFGQSFEPMAINNLIIPVTELKGSYTEFTLFSYRENNGDWLVHDSILFSEVRLKEFVLNENGQISKHTYRPGNYSYGSKEEYYYDKSNKLIEIQFKNKASELKGKTCFSYNGNYSAVYKIYKNDVASSIDTSRLYQFDSIGRIKFCEIYNDEFLLKQTYQFNDQGLAERVVEKLYKNAADYGETEFLFTYKYNELGDWIELLIEQVVESNKLQDFMYKRVLK